MRDPWYAAEAPRVIFMNMMYNFLLEENERLRKQLDDLKNFLPVVQVACSHLLQDGAVDSDGEKSVKDLLSLTEDLQNKYAKED